MQQMPKVWKCPTNTREDDENHYVTMAIYLHNGNRHSRSFAPRKKQVKFLLVAIDYFMKWVEAKAQSIITEARIHKFVWKNIICRFSIPRTIILDNGRQFNSQDLGRFAQTLVSRIDSLHHIILRPTDRQKSLVEHY